MIYVLYLFLGTLFFQCNLLHAHSVTDAARSEPIRSITDIPKEKDLPNNSEKQLFSHISPDIQRLIIPEIKRILDRGKLIVFMTNDSNNVLFQMKTSDGDYKGIDIEISENIANLLGVKLEINRKYKTYDQVVDAIARGEGDIAISKLSYTVERSQKVHFTSPYVILRKALLLNRIGLTHFGENLTLREILNNQKTKLATVSGSYDSFSKHLFPKASLTIDEWDKHIIPGLLKGKFLGAFRDELRIKMVLKQNPQASLTLLPITLKDEQDPIRMAVNKKDLGLLLWLESVITNTFKPLTIDELFLRYEKYIVSETN